MGNDTVRRPGEMTRPCIIAGCESRKRGSRGMCANHYAKWRRGSDPNEDHVRGPKHPLWLADADLTYTAAHLRVGRSRGSAADHPCAMCGESAQNWAYMHGSTRELVDEQGRVYSPDPADYQALCLPCHRAYDFTGKCTAGHLYDEQNTYIDPKGNRSCRACRRRRTRELRARRAAKASA